MWKCLTMVGPDTLGSTPLLGYWCIANVVPRLEDAEDNKSDTKNCLIYTLFKDRDWAESRLMGSFLSARENPHSRTGAGKKRLYLPQGDGWALITTLQGTIAPDSSTICKPLLSVGWNSTWSLHNSKQLWWYLLVSIPESCPFNVHLTIFYSRKSCSSIFHIFILYNYVGLCHFSLFQVASYTMVSRPKHIV